MSEITPEQTEGLTIWQVQTYLKAADAGRIKHGGSMVGLARFASEQHARAEAAEARVMVLREALEFYAVWEHYHVPSQYLLDDQTGERHWVMPKSETEKDHRGDRARQALAAAQAGEGQ